jgi:hypothetical protein
MASNTTDPALDAIWSANRTWAETAGYYKRIIDAWGIRTLWLALAGAVLAAVDQQIAPLAEHNSLFKAPGLLGAALIVLATYFTAQMLNSDNQKLWIRSRSAAESLKSVVYLYRASASPFAGPDKASNAAQRIQTILEQVKDISPRQAAIKPMPSAAPLTVDQYITGRVDDQITWYEKRALEFQTKADGFRYAVIVLGVASVILGVIATMLAVSPWIAVIATATTAISAYVKNRKYQDLIALYSNTAVRLRTLKATWSGSGKTDADKPDRDAFIQRCEETMSAENGSWVAQWSQQSSSAS